MRWARIGGAVAVGLVTLAGAAVRASDFVGVYCLPDRVVLEPNDTEPQRIAIWGAFLLSDGQHGNGYQTAVRGYVYYTCPTGKDTTCFNEWSDLKSLAGSGKAVGYGMRYQETGRVRKVGDPLASPDPYPMQFGLVRLGGDAYGSELLAQLKAAK